MRTVRRFLEKWRDDIDHIVFCFDNKEDADFYRKVVPLYFPRNEEEEIYAREHLPADTGNDDGEHVITERKIKINAFPIHPNLSKNLFESKSKPRLPFEPLIQRKDDPNAAISYNQLVPDQDEIRREKIQKQLKSMNKDQKSNLKYERLLRDSRAEDLSDIAKLGFIYKSGRDVDGRIVIVIVARHLPAKKINMDRVLLYIIRVMDAIVEREYSIVYVHSTMKSQNQPELSWMQEVTSIFNRKYRKNLKQFFVVHPTFWVKMVFWALTPIISDKFLGNKLKYINSISELEKYLKTDQLSLPAEVVSHDRRKSRSNSKADEQKNVTKEDTTAANRSSNTANNTRVSGVNL